MTTPKWITQVFERPDETPQEGTDSRAEEVGEVGLLQGERNPDRAAGVTLTSKGGTPDPDAKPAKAIIRQKGEAPAQLPQEYLDARSAIAEKEVAFEEAQSFTRLNTGRALAQTKAQAQEIAATDAAEMSRLNRQYFQRWETENQRLRDDIDAARQLRVNPHNFRQSIGRSGRVASVLSVAVSQLAAGAGNPSMVWNRVKSTIDQDITAQKANIELEFKGIEAAQGQQDHEAAMLEKYYGFEEEQRAVAFTALEAQVGVIMQRSANEMEYQAYQMIRDRAAAEAIDAAAAAFAKQSTLYLDAPVHRAYQALINQRRFEEAQAMLAQAFAEKELGGAPEVDPTIQSYDQFGQPVTFGTPADAAPAEAPAAPAEPAAPAPRAAAPAKKRVRPTEAVEAEAPVAETPAEAPAAAPEEPRVGPAEASRQFEMEQTLGRPEVTDAPSPVLTAEEQAERDTERKRLQAQVAAVETEKGIRQRMGDDVLRKGGFRFDLEESRGTRPEVLRGQGVNTFFEARDIILNPTDPRINVFPSYPDAVEGLKYDTRTGAKAAYERKHPELYEQDLFIEHEGTKTKPRWIEQNYVDTAWGRLKLSRTTSLRSDTDKREEFAEQVNTDFTRAEDIHRQAQTISKYGTTNFMGLQITDEGLTWPGGEGAAQALQEKLSGQIGLAIQAMKLLDPSGRLTDQDIIVGKEYVTAVLQNPGVKMFDTFSSIYRKVTGKDPSQGDLRRALNKTLKAMATKLGDAVAKKNHGKFVYSYEQDRKFRDQTGEVEKWLRSEDK